MKVLRESMPHAMSDVMKLIVGLGNPGRKYETTRHNVGFDVLDVVAKRCAADAAKDKFDGRLVDTTIGGQRALLLWPHTLMNRSGQSVLGAINFYQVPLSDILVVCDDFNLPLGTLRFRSQGSYGGQKGLQDIIRRLGTEEINRVRLGIGPVPDSWDPADFVLARFTARERPEIDVTIERAADGVECWVTDGIQESMNRFNKAP